MIQIQITQIGNGWVVVATIFNQETEKPVGMPAIYAADTIDVFKVLKNLLPAEKPTIVKREVE